MQSIIIAATTQYSLGATDPGAGSLITFKTVGLTGTCSVIPKIRKPGDGTSNLVTVPYTNVTTGLTVAAGTAITADGAYQIEATGPENILDATVSSGTATIVWWLVEGGVAGGGGGGGGGTGGAVTAIAGAFADGAITTIGTEADAPQATTTTTAPATLISLEKGIYNQVSVVPSGPLAVQQQDGVSSLILNPASTVIAATAVSVPVSVLPNSPLSLSGGSVSTGSSVSAVKPLIVGGSDASGNAQPLPIALLDSAPTSATQEGVVVLAYLNAHNGTASNPLWTISSVGADGISGANTLSTGHWEYSGTGWDRKRNNTAVTLLASAAHTTTQTSADLVNYNGRGIQVILDTTVISTGSITLTVNGKDPASGKYYLLLAGAIVTATPATNVYTIFPGATGVTNVTGNNFLPRTFQIVVTANNANSATYSVGYNILS